MVKFKPKINLFDLIITVIVLLAIFVVLFAYENRPHLGSKPMLIVVQIKDDDAINRVMSELDFTEEVYFNSTKYPIIQRGYWLVDDETGGQDLNITLSGMGDIEDGNSIFNGQRIFINQKVELRSDYFVQGYVIEYRYE
jgi:hypothetical protein